MSLWTKKDMFEFGKGLDIENFDRETCKICGTEFSLVGRDWVSGGVECPNCGHVETSALLNWSEEE